MDESNSPEIAYDQNGPLERIFRNAISRVLDFLLSSPEFDYSIPEISKSTQIPIRTLQRVLPSLVEQGLAKERRKVGNTTMYILKNDSPLVKALQQYVNSAIDLNFQMTEHNMAQRNNA